VAWWLEINFSSCELVLRMLCALHEYIYIYTLHDPFLGLLLPNPVSVHFWVVSVSLSGMH
jgi:hypothetical protein